MGERDDLAGLDATIAELTARRAALRAQHERLLQELRAYVLGTAAYRACNDRCQATLREIRAVDAERELARQARAAGGGRAT